MIRRSNEETRYILPALVTVMLVATALFGQQAATPTPPTQSPPKPAQPATTSKTPATARPTGPAKSSFGQGDKVVLRVAGNEVTQADLDFVLNRLNPQAQQAIARQGKRPVGDQYALMLILSGQATSQHLDASPDFHRQMALQRIQLLAQAEYDVLVKQTNVSPEDTSQYYSQHQAEFEEAQIRQVVIRKKADGAAAEAPGLPAADARARADEIRKALSSGTDFSKLVKDFSVPNVVTFDAEPRAVRHGQVMADLDKAIFQLKDGEISQPVETPQALVLVQAVSHRVPELKAVSTEITNKLRQGKVDKLLADLRQKNPVWMDDEYFAAPASPPAATPPQAPAGNPAPQK